MDKEQLTKAKSYTPTEAMRNNAKRGLALIEKWNRGGSNIKDSFVSNDLIDSDITLAAVKKLHAFFEQHEKSYQPNKRESDGGPSASTIAWIACGGSAGRAWARSILRQEQILKSYTKEITEQELNSEDVLPINHLQVAKSLDQELKQVTYVAMKADSTDSHGDYTSVEEVRKAKESFNRALLKKQTMSNLFHMYETNSFDVIESYISPADMTLNGHLVKKGDWLMTLQINDDSLWEMVKKQEVVGLSIGAIAQVETLE
jgi:hypothetical protein